MKLKSTKEINEQVLKVMSIYKRLTRKELVQLTNLSDRQVRLAIAELRDQGYMIGITANGGYSFNIPEDFSRAIANYKARAREEERRIRIMERTLEEHQLTGQMSWSF